MLVNDNVKINELYCAHLDYMENHLAQYGRGRDIKMIIKEK